MTSISVFIYLLDNVILHLGTCKDASSRAPQAITDEREFENLISNRERAENGARQPVNHIHGFGAEGEWKKREMSIIFFSSIRRPQNAVLRHLAE